MFWGAKSSCSIKYLSESLGDCFTFEAVVLFFYVLWKLIRNGWLAYVHDTPLLFPFFKVLFWMKFDIYIYLTATVSDSMKVTRFSHFKILKGYSSYIYIYIYIYNILNLNLKFWIIFLKNNIKYYYITKATKIII